MCEHDVIRFWKWFGVICVVVLVGIYATACTPATCVRWSCEGEVSTVGTGSIYGTECECVEPKAQASGEAR